MIRPAFWRGKRVLVTGHTGFKGAWLSLWLQQMGANLTGLALAPPTRPSLFEITGAHDGMLSIVGDIRDSETVAKAMATKPEIVMHMAAQPLVREAYRHPIATYSTNVMGLINVLEGIRQTPSVRAVVNVTSDKCYENREWNWGYRETDAMGGYDPYSSSKGCAELITAAWRQSYFNPETFLTHGVALATARAGNVIGGGDWAVDRLVPDTLRAFASGNPVCIRNPNAIRPWQHVLEPLHGYLSLAEHLIEKGCAYAQGWNFGPGDGDGRQVDWVVKHLAQLWGPDASWAVDSTDSPHEAHHLSLDSSKARKGLGWLPVWSLAQTLEKIVDWHKSLVSGENMKSVTLMQIHAFEQSLQPKNAKG